MLTEEPRALLISGLWASASHRWPRRLGDSCASSCTAARVLRLVRNNAELEPAAARVLRLVRNNAQPDARNALAAGARHLVVAGVVENRAERDRYADALGVPVTLCRLRADLDLVRGRLRRRHAADPGGLHWHLNRCLELDAVLERSKAEDFAVDLGDRGVEETATEVVRRWLG